MQNFANSVVYVVNPIQSRTPIARMGAVGYRRIAFEKGSETWAIRPAM